MDNINFKKVIDDGELFDQQANYEENFEKINQEVVPKITDLETNKVDKVAGKGLSTNDYTTTDKNKLAGIPADTATQLSGKVDKVTGKGLSTNDFDNTYKQKIDVDIPAQLAETDQRIDAIITTPVPTGEIIAQEIIDARQGEVSVGANIAEVKSQLAETMEDVSTNVRSKIFNNEPIITFVTDDGLNADYRIMKPVFESAGVPFVTAVVTGKIGVDPNYCTLAQLNELKNIGVEVCSHTHTHRTLTALSDKELDDELRLSQEWLRNNGFSHKSFCIPYNIFGDRERKYFAKYYDCARSSNLVGTGYNDTPIASYELSTKFLSKTDTLATIQPLIDKAVANNGWLIISTHSWEIEDWGISAALTQIVNYAKSRCDIVTLAEGLRRKRNIIESGKFRNAIEERHLDHFNVSQNGKVTSNYVTNKLMQQNSVDGNTSIDAFEENVCSICFLSSDKPNLPNGNKAGYLYTYKYCVYNGSDEIPYYYQTFKEYNTTNQYIRKCNSDKTWGAWEKLSTDVEKFAHVKGWVTNASTLGSYNKGMTLSEVSNASSTGLPESKGGLLITYRSESVEDYVYSYQIYKPIGSDTLYSRKSNSLTTWGTWKNLNDNVVNIVANVYNGLTALSSFPAGKITYNTIQTASADAGLPVQAAGVLITYNISTEAGYCYQEYKRYGSNEKWIRYATSLTAWGTWAKYTVV